VRVVDIILFIQYYFLTEEKILIRKSKCVIKVAGCIQPRNDIGGLNLAAGMSEGLDAISHLLSIGFCWG
jgi:hypothetical protein